MFDVKPLVNHTVNLQKKKLQCLNIWKYFRSKHEMKKKPVKTFHHHHHHSFLFFFCFLQNLFRLIDFNLFLLDYWLSNTDFDDDDDDGDPGTVNLKQAGFRFCLFSPSFSSFFLLLLKMDLHNLDWLNQICI